MNDYRYRLVTRADFDGLVCAMLLRELNILDDILFVHPKDVQDGNVDITDRDILTNLPYDARCHLCFDHHDSEELRAGDDVRTNHILEAGADSAARVVYNYYGGAATFPTVDPELMNAVDRADAARFDRMDILAPQRWALLSFVMDPRTGLGRFRKFRISNYQLMMDLIDYCRTLTIDEILALPDVQERIEVYNIQRELFVEQIGRCSAVFENVVVLDLRDQETIYAGNRFVIYALYPECNVSIHVMRGRYDETTILAMGKSILNRTNPVNIGGLCLEHGGGGHAAAGTCQIPTDQADDILPHVITALNRTHEVETDIEKLVDLATKQQPATL